MTACRQRKGVGGMRLAHDPARSVPAKLNRKADPAFSVNFDESARKSFSAQHLLPQKQCRELSQGTGCRRRLPASNILLELHTDSGALPHFDELSATARCRGTGKAYMRIFGVFKNIGARLTGKTVLDEQTADELEEALIQADVALDTVDRIMERLRETKAHPDGVQASLRQVLAEILHAHGDNRLCTAPEPPAVIFLAGVNGVGKTTTIAKLAHRYIRQGQPVLLAAADTFRAAAIDQLEIWAGRVGADIVKHKPGADPAAVVYDAVSAAKARGTGVVIVDTAGRMHTKSNLMDELRKISRSVEKANGREPDETLLVLDATTGQNAVAQAREFMNAIPVTGLVLAKMDSSARGGTAISIADELGCPVKLIGTGESLDDLQDFDAEQFVASLFEQD